MTVPRWVYRLQWNRFQYRYTGCFLQVEFILSYKSEVDFSEVWEAQRNKNPMSLCLANPHYYFLYNMNCVPDYGAPKSFWISSPLLPLYDISYVIANSVDRSSEIFIFYTRLCSKKYRFYKLICNKEKFHVGVGTHWKSQTAGYYSVVYAVTL